MLHQGSLHLSPAIIFCKIALCIFEKSSRREYTYSVSRDSYEQLFLAHPLLRPKMNLPNQNFYRFSCSKQLQEKSYLKKLLKRTLCVEFERNRSNCS